MTCTKPETGTYGKRTRGSCTEPIPCRTRRTDAPVAYRVEFYLVYVVISVSGFAMSWMGRPRVPGDGRRTAAHLTPAADDDRDGGADLRLVRDLSTTVASSAATPALHWIQADPDATAEESARDQTLPVNRGGAGSGRCPAGGTT